MNTLRIACCAALLGFVTLPALAAEDLPPPLVELGKRADAGDPRAMYDIGRAFGNGSLGQRDLFRSCVWMLRTERNSANADAQLKTTANAVAGYCQQTLAPDQYAEARKLADNYPPKAAK